MADCYGQRLNYVAVSIANILAECLDDDEIGLVSNLLRLVAESLDVIPTVNNLCDKKHDNFIV